MDYSSLLLRSAEFHPRLQEAKSAYFSSRQGLETELARTERKAILLYLQDIVL